MPMPQHTPTTAGPLPALVLTDRYPSPERLYANMFVHQRVLGYVARGQAVRVFVCREGLAAGEYRFEGVDVAQGSPEDLRARLLQGGYGCLLVHFLGDGIMSAIDGAGVQAPIFVWMHGYEAMSWLRRWFFFDLGGLLRRGGGRAPAQPAAGNAPGGSAVAPPSHKSLGYYARKFAAQVFHLRRLRDFLRRHREQLDVVFVSQWLRGIVAKDVGLPEGLRAHVIHNPIDTDAFAYVPKRAEQRYKLLSIRSFSNRKYANDITVKAIELLSRKPYFDRLDILVAGDGPLFERVTGPLKRFPNVQVRRQFFTQEQMAALYRDYGVFLCPTRMDTQGVSMGEAMASGMVCVSSDNSAIPEFLPETAGFRTRGPRGVAAAVDLLVKNDERYAILSENAAAAVRVKCAAEDILKQELELIAGAQRQQHV